MKAKASSKIIARMKEENEYFKKGKNVADKVIQNLKEELLVKGKKVCNAQKMAEDYKN